MRRLGLSLFAVLVGWLFARAAHVSAITGSTLYVQLASLLLAIGLFASTHSISLAEAREHLRLVLLAVTLGVVAKAGIIAVVLVLCFHRPEYLVLGIAVAQIDPLSVATQVSGKKATPAARTILYAWASFDDPVTVLLTVYLSTIALGGGHAAVNHGLAASLWGLAANVIVAAVAGLWVWRRHRDWRMASTGSRRRTAADWLDIVFLGGLLVGAAHYSLLLGVAFSGLFFRPAAFGSLDRITRYAFYTAAAMLGVVLVHGFSLLIGVVLGGTAFLAQGLVALPLTRRMTWPERRYLMLAQQNGITAIVLALVLEPDFPGTVAIIAPAVLVINALNIVSNQLFEDGSSLARLLPVRRSGPAPTPAGQVDPVMAGVAGGATPPPTPPASPAVRAHRGRQGLPAGRTRG